MQRVTRTSKTGLCFSFYFRTTKNTVMYAHFKVYLKYQLRNVYTEQIQLLRNFYGFDGLYIIRVYTTEAIKIVYLHLLY